MEGVDTASTGSSFRRYEKMKELEDKDFQFQLKSRRRFVTITVSLALLLIIFAGAAIATIVSTRSNKAKCPPGPSCNGSSGGGGPLPLAISIQAVCSVTLYPSSCFAALMSAEQASNRTSAQPVELFRLSLLLAKYELSKLSFDPKTLFGGSAGGLYNQTTNATRRYIAEALQICTAMRDDSIQLLGDSLGLVTSSIQRLVITPTVVDDIRTWLSAAVTNLQTCLDGFNLDDGEPLNATTSIAGFSSGLVRLRTKRIEAGLRNATELTSNCLAIATWILNRFQKAQGTDSQNPPFHSRRLMQLQNSSSTEQTPLADLVVSTDGSGNFTTITDALSVVPRQSSTPFVIYVKSGVYVENVVVESSMWNVALIGDGIGNTVISGSKSAADGIPTFNTATFVVQGRGFLASGISFRNTAGPESQQAVAVLCKADQAVFYLCSFDGYQDTLYAHSMRQFYRECEISGTVDFIFGNAAVIFQGCTIRPKQPLPGQSNTITAQSRSDPNQNTGTAIQESAIDGSQVPSSDSSRTYLGRPWGTHATVVFMQSGIGAVVDPLGWSLWTGQITPPATIFFGEYQNTGPGSSTAQRVQWSGYHPTMTPAELQRFTVAALIQGIPWISNKGVPFA